MAKRVILKPGQHAHRCRMCSTIWAHTREEADCDNEQAHQCPNCGESEFFIHRNYGEKKARRVTERDRRRMQAAELLLGLLEFAVHYKRISR